MPTLGSQLSSGRSSPHTAGLIASVSPAGTPNKNKLRVASGNVSDPGPSSFSSWLSSFPVAVQGRGESPPVLKVAWPGFVASVPQGPVMESGLRCTSSTCQYMQDQWEGLEREMSIRKISSLCLWSVSFIEKYLFEGKMFLMYLKL